MYMRTIIFILASTAVVCVQAEDSEETYQGYRGSWVEVVATAYSPQDPIDAGYHATKGKWRWVSADGKTDVREEPYGVAVPLKRGTRKPEWAFGTKLIIPSSTGYVPVGGPASRIFEVDDVGNGRQYFRRDSQGRLHIDLRFKTVYSAVRWAGPEGKRVIRVFRISGIAIPDTSPVVEISCNGNNAR